MKKFLLAAAAASMVAMPVLAAPAAAAPQSHHGDRNGHGHDNRGHDSRGHDNHYRSWHKGDRFDRRYARNYRQIDWRRYRGHHVYAPPRGYRWVQSGNDAVLVGITSGLIAAVVANAIR